MKNKLFYFLLVLFSLVLPSAFAKTPLTGVAFLCTLVGVFGAGRAFCAFVFPSKHFELNSFGIGFMLFSGFAFFIAFFNLNAVYFEVIYIASLFYGIYWLINFFRSGDPAKINKIAVVIYLLVLVFNLYPTLLIQGYDHNNSLLWINTDATVYTSITNRVKLGIYPITIPGFGVEKLYYHYGIYAFAGLTANIFHLSASDSLFGIIRSLAIFSIILSIISIAETAPGKSRIPFRIAGALIGFFFIGSLTSVFEYLPFHFPRINHGMKHLRGFLIGHSALWIFISLIPVLSFINYKIVHKIRFTFSRIALFAILVLFSITMNFVTGAICSCMAVFFLLFYNMSQASNPVFVRRNLLIILVPFILVLAGTAAYLHLSVHNITSSLFIIPVFDLGTWSNYLEVFFILYLGLRIFGLNYIFSKKQIHFGYFQFIIFLAALSFMTLLCFFIEGGRENDIKYGYVILEGTSGLFSGLWFAEKLENVWNNKSRSLLVGLKKICYPFIIIFSLLLLIAVMGFVNSRLAPGLAPAFKRPVLIFSVLIIFLLLLTRYKKSIALNRNLVLALFGVLILCSIPGVFHEFNKYRSIKNNDEVVRLSTAELKMVSQINKLNDKNKLVFLALADHRSIDFVTTYKYSAMINAPVLNEGSQYFGVKNKTEFIAIANRLDSFYLTQNISLLKNMADQYEIAFCLFSTRMVNPAIFDNSNEFKFRSDKTDSTFIIEYLPNK